MCISNAANAELFWPEGFPGVCGQPKGTAFSQCPLPSTLISVLEDLSIIDFAMGQSRTRKVKDKAVRQLIGARDGAQHRLVASPSWNELDDDARAKTSHQLYECTRLTAIIYSNAVVYAYPPHSGWHVKLVAQLANSQIGRAHV